jgi:transcriptional regulator with XRE-family HTH domain
MDMNEQIRKVAKEALEKKKISQLELAQKAGVRQATVSRFLTGERGKADTASEILGALGLELVAVPKGTDVSKFFRKAK